ncbi:hypothetical protein F66182_7978 [Fusarium sp. NRRL 66182]|nr:hypothetical protein F66182_7978 [Fusarium sp. NRRL 66182]
MPAPKKDGIAGGGSGGKQNGSRASFRTDTAISKNRFGNERVLQPWIPDANDTFNGSLEKSSGSGAWDQFAENEKLFGVKSTYDENEYTTAINRNHPEYKERSMAAERKAREIERSAPATAHVAEERVMDYVGGEDGGDEEDKYSGVRRQDFPPLSGGRENKYTPPAKRAPAAQSTVKGAPIDPAIISSQIKAPPKKQTPTPEESKSQAPDVNKNGSIPKVDAQKLPAEIKVTEAPTNDSKPNAQQANSKAAETKHNDAVNAASRSSAVGGQTTAAPTPSATSTVEHDVLKEFKTFASQQRQNAEKARSNKAKQDKEVKLTELKKFANSFKLSTPVPTDLVSIIAKDPLKQQEIQAKAIKNAEEVAKAKASAVTKDKATPSKDSQAKTSGQGTPTAVGTSAPPSETRAARGPANNQPTHAAGAQPRHPGARQQYAQQPYHGQQYRNNRGGPHMPQQQTGSLAQRLRHVEQQKYSQPPVPHQSNAPGQEMRAPPTGPASTVESGYNRRPSGNPGHMGAKLNPNSHEFRPSPFAAAFNPNSHASAGSSPRSAVNHVDASTNNAASEGQLIRRKTKAIDVNKCYILSQVQTLTPPQGRNWDDNAGLRPSYDTLPTWRQLLDNEKTDSTMHLTYKEYFERQPFGGPALATPNPQHVVPQAPHQHQLPFHLQQGAHMPPRGSPHMPPMQMHTPQHGHVPHPPYGNDDHRMMHSNSAQSFASPRLGNVPVAYNSPAQVPYNQAYMGPSTPQMNQFRNFSNNHPYMAPQQGQMGGPMMMPQQYMPGPQGIIPGPQMMYPGGHPQYMPPSGPQPVPGVNGYPSPGRPAAPMMAHQGSQQGQPMYGMSPNVQYNQLAFNPGQQGGPMRGGYGSPGPQHFGTSPQQGHQYAAQHRNGSNNYNKGYGSQGPHQTPQSNHAVPAVNQARPSEASDEAK